MFVYLLLAACAFPNVARGASHCGAFYCCCTWAQLLPAIWDLPRLGIEPLVSGFFTSGPPGMSFFLKILKLVFFFLSSVTGSQCVSFYCITK